MLELAVIAASCFEVCKTSRSSAKRTACHFLHCAKSNIKSTRDSVLRPRFKALPEKILAELSGNTSRTRFFAQNGGEKALNRCDVPALQRKDLERTAKEQPCSLRTVGYGWVRMENGARKRVALGGDKKDFLQMKTFSVCEKGGFFCSCKAMPK